MELVEYSSGIRDGAASVRKTKKETFMLVKLALLLLLTSNGYERENVPLPLSARVPLDLIRGRWRSEERAFSPARGVPGCQGRSRARWWTIVRARARCIPRNISRNEGRVELEISRSLRRISSLALKRTHWPPSFSFSSSLLMSHYFWTGLGQAKKATKGNEVPGKKPYTHDLSSSKFVNFFFSPRA